MPGIRKREKISLDKKQFAKVPHKPAADITAPLHLCHSNPHLQHKAAGWKSWAYTDGNCQVQDCSGWQNSYTVGISACIVSRGGGEVPKTISKKTEQTQKKERKKEEQALCSNKQREAGALKSQVFAKLLIKGGGGGARAKSRI
eukprot:1160720-Pelagomonas_calceolata.AAC.21